MHDNIAKIPLDLSAYTVLGHRDDLLIPTSNHSPSHSPCYIDSVPPEIISEILVIACDNAGDSVRLKWIFPSIVNRLSKRFYNITAQTHALWRYIYIRNTPYPFDHVLWRVSRPHKRPFAADLYCCEWSSRETGVLPGQNWAKLLRIVTPILPNLSTLSICSSLDNPSIFSLLDEHMPMLEILRIEGYQCYDGLGPDARLSTVKFPALRILTSKGYLQWDNGDKIPETVEELHLDMDTDRGVRRQDGFWEFFPAKLRVLKLEGFNWTPPQNNEKRQLPYLTELSFPECWSLEELEILQYLDGSRLQKLSIRATENLYYGMGSLHIPLALPSLTHFVWQSPYKQPSFAGLLRQCTALVSVRLSTFEPTDEVSRFVESLAEDPTLLPRLEDLKVLGTSVFTLRKVVQTRPHFKRLEVHVSDLGLKPLATKEEFREWEECMDWLECHVELAGNRVGCPGVGLYDPVFYEGSLPRYRSWGDMVAGRAIDMPDWKGIEEVDTEFWENYARERSIENGRSHCRRSKWTF